MIYNDLLESYFDEITSYDLYHFAKPNPSYYKEILSRHNLKPEDRLAQKTLAKEVITFLHGEEEYEKALKITESLFSGDIKSFTSKEVEEAFKGLEPFKVNEDKIIVDLLTIQCAVNKAIFHLM